MESLAALPFFQFRLAFSCDVLVRGRHAVSVLSIRASVYSVAMSVLLQLPPISALSNCQTI